MATTTVYQNGAPSYTSTNGVVSPISGSSSSSGGNKGSYTPEQVATINAARDANVNAGKSAYSGSGATVNSNALGQGSGTPLYAAPTTINSNNTQPNTGVTLPVPPAATNTGTNAMTQLAGIAASAKALQDSYNADQNKKTDTTSGDTAFQEMLKSMQKPVNTADEYATAKNESGVVADQALVNSLQGQLAAITAKAQADKLSLVGKGNGVPNPIIGGQQAEIDREAAIQALPISAQLSAAQGNLTVAQDNLDTLFKLRSEDAQAQVTYNNSLVKAVYDYATEKQKIQLATIQKTNDQNFSLMTNNLNYAQSLATEAIKNGQPSIAAQLMKLDHNDPNYAANIATLAKGIVVEKKSVGLTTEQTDAILGTALNDANAAITGGADPTAVRAAFLVKHPTDAGKWDDFFSAGGTTANPVVYPEGPKAAKGAFNLFDPSTW